MLTICTHITALPSPHSTHSHPHAPTPAPTEPLEQDVLATVGHSVGQQPGGGHMLVPVGLHQQDLSNLAAAAAVGTPLTATLSSATTAAPVAPPEPQQPVSVQMYVCVQYTLRGSNVCSLQIQ